MLSPAARGPGRPRRGPGGAAILFAAGLAGCAPTLNYLDPVGPSHEGRYAGPPPVLAAAEDGAPFRVVTFNIAFARAIDEALAVLEETTALQRPDVLALQEMDAPSVERMARTLRLNFVFAPGGVHPRTDRDFGCALLSPWPLVEPRKVVLPHAARVTRLRRAAVAATVVRGEQRVRVYSVHLGSPFGISGGSRRDQVRAVLADAEGSTDAVVIAGDFNSHGIGEELVAAGYTWVTRDVGATTRFLFFGLSFDHVFVRGLDPLPGDSASGVVEDNRGASDHHPVWAVLGPARSHGGLGGERGALTTARRRN